MVATLDQFNITALRNGRHLASIESAGRSTGGAERGRGGTEKDREKGRRGVGWRDRDREIGREGDDRQTDRQRDRDRRRIECFKRA